MRIGIIEYLSLGQDIRRSCWPKGDFITVKAGRVVFVEGSKGEGAYTTRLLDLRSEELAADDWEFCTEKAAEPPLRDLVPVVTSGIAGRMGEEEQRFFPRWNLIWSIQDLFRAVVNLNRRVRHLEGREG
jgi:hypothetical protein